MLIQPRINYKLNHSDYLAVIASYVKSGKDDVFLNELFKGYDILFFDKARNGLRFILENINIPEARIGIQPLTCPTVLEAIYLANCTPVFIDISDDYSISIESVQKKLNEIDVLIITHTFGIHANTLKLKEILKNKILIEDCAHALLSTNSYGKIAGSDADFSIFSFGFGKFPAAISGGFVCINNNKSDKYILSYTKSFEHPTIKKQLVNIIQSIVLPILNHKFVYTFITLKIKKRNHEKNSYSLPTKLALKISYLNSNKLLFFHQLRKITRNLQKQKNNGEILIEAIDKNSFISSCLKLKNSNFFMLPVQVVNSNYFIQVCLKNGIEVGRHFVKTREIINSYGYNQGDCPNYEQLIINLVTLPTHYNYPDDKIKLLADIITNYKPA